MLRFLSLFATESGSVLTIEYKGQENNARHLACYKRSYLYCIRRVVNGDTLENDGQPIMLYGIDAPESLQSCADADGEKYPCGLNAASALEKEVGDKIINCVAKGTDRIGRMRAICYSGSTNLNEWMAENGWAVAYRVYSRRYVKPESVAKMQQLNIWQGIFISPWTWREQRDKRKNWEWKGDWEYLKPPSQRWQEDRGYLERYPNYLLLGGSQSLPGEWEEEKKPDLSS